MVTIRRRGRPAALLGVGLLALCAGCGGGGAMRSWAASPPSAGATAPGTPAPVAAASTPREEDSDADGVPDQADVAPARGNLFSAPSAPSAPAAPGAPAQPGSRPVPEGKPAGAEDAPRPGEFLIYTAQITMAVYQVEAALDAVEQIARAEGGYLASRADQQISIRVPRARFEDALKKVEATGDVVHRDVQAQDVTDEFRDVEVRLKNARAMRDRLEALLAKALVKEAIEIERELGRVTQDIERMEGRLKLLRDKIAYSTITVTYSARSASLKTMPIRLPFPWLGTLGLPTLLRLDETKK